jgi:hypothetical protein
METGGVTLLEGSRVWEFRWSAMRSMIAEVSTEVSKGSAVGLIPIAAPRLQEHAHEPDRQR